VGTDSPFITVDDIAEAKRMFGFQFWFAPVLFSATACGLGTGFVVFREPVLLFLFLLFVIFALLNVLLRAREYTAFRSDLELGRVEAIEAAPEKVWINRRGVTANGFCYVRIKRLRIRVPSQLYGDLREANLVKIVFLPTCRVAVRVEIAHGLGIGR